MKNLFLLLCCFVFGVILAEQMKSDKFTIPKIDNNTSVDIKPVAEEVISNISDKLTKRKKNKTYTNWWTKGADSLDMLYSGEELVTKMCYYVHSNIKYINDTTLESSYHIGDISYSNFDIRKHIKYNLYKHKGVCVDYSICFMLMCEYLNVKVNCIGVPNHMLNIVNIKGKRIYVDATADMIYHTSKEMKDDIIIDLKGEKTVYAKRYGEITYPEKFDYHVYYKDNNDENIYAIKPHNIYESFGSSYSKEDIDIIKGI